MLEPIGLIHIIIPTDALHNMGHKKCTANKSSFHSNGEENYRFKKNQVKYQKKLISKNKISMFQKTWQWRYYQICDDWDTLYGEPLKTLALKLKLLLRNSVGRADLFTFWQKGKFESPLVQVSVNYPLSETLFRVLDGSSYGRTGVQEPQPCFRGICWLGTLWHC